ncbi:hypothetical protein MVEN_00610400 [Mycena venus]|uniref:DUF6535 domain-containing protein n=1 Tax=Mycena venus TaxID=2733690 RepID=A0A8H6YRH3_9AGAR|nr:hypothetical protein MVEN_00610400 [Mycena venus]
MDNTHLEKERADPTNDNAATKLWAVYIAEAEKYDKALVESWRSDMNGMLIFAGLFSAILTAFLIESYKTLTPDSGEATVNLLAQISRQLSAAANGSTLIVPSNISFTPSTTSIICNTLWFIGLGLSLTCALIATLLEQWARDFLHRTEIRSSVIIRARVFSYLYCGLSRFKMHIAVELIPLLLHISLVFFFAGLIAFLVPVNTVIMAVAAGIFAFVTCVYATLTILPLIRLDCPYRTPLSGALWRLMQRVHLFLRQSGASDRTEVAISTSHVKTPMESMFDAATKYSKERFQRDDDAILWTMKSLVDDNELGAFMEAIPDVLWSHEKRRYAYDEHVRHLVDHPDVRLLGRMEHFRHNLSSGLLTTEVSKRRRVLLYKAIWAIGSLCTPGGFSDQTFPDIGRDPDTDAEILHYHASAQAMAHWGNFCAAQSLIHEALRLLNVYKSDKELGGAPDIRPFEDCEQKLHSYGIHLSGYRNWMLQKHMFTARPGIEEAHVPLPTTSLIEEIRGLSSTIPLGIFIRFLTASAAPKSPLYQFDHTRRIISPPRVLLSKEMLNMLHSGLETVVSEKGHASDADGLHRMDDIIRYMISYWDPAAVGPGSRVLPQPFITHLNQCGQQTLEALVHSLPANLWACISATIFHGPFTPQDAVRVRDPAVLNETLIATWRVCSCYDLLENVPITTWEAILEAVSQAISPSLTPSVMAMGKWAVVQAVFWRNGAQVLKDHTSPFTHPVLPLETVVEVPLEFSSVTWEAFRARVIEGWLHTLTEYIECCAMVGLPLMALETVKTIGKFSPQFAIHPDHQTRFALAIQRLFGACTAPTHQEFLRTILDLALFHIYHDPHGSVPWLTSTDARRTLKDTFIQYLGQLSSTESPEIVRRLERITLNLDELHTERPGSDSRQSSILDQPMEASVQCTGGEDIHSRLERPASGLVWKVANET